MHVHILLDGTIFGFWPVHWSISESLKPDQAVYATWLTGWLNGTPVKVGSVLKGTISVQVTT